MCLIEMQPWELIPTFANLCSGSTSNVEVSKGDNSQCCYGTLSEQDIGKLTAADSLARRNDEAIEIL